MTERNERLGKTISAVLEEKPVSRNNDILDRPAVSAYADSASPKLPASPLRLPSKAALPRWIGNCNSRIKVVVLTLLFSLILAFVFARVLIPSAGKILPEDFNADNAAADSVIKIDWKIPQPYPAALRDPMQINSAAVAASLDAAKFIVKGIVYSEDKPAAVVDGRIVHQGDKVFDADVVKINRDSVEFETNGKRWIQKVQ